METQTNEKYVPPLRAIRLRCLDCSGDSYTEVELCPVTNCSLWHYRFGKNPFRKKREMSEENRMKAAERIRQYHQSRKGKLQDEISEEEEDDL